MVASDKEKEEREFTETLYNLLPSVYRQETPDNTEPLKRFLSIFAGELRQLFILAQSLKNILDVQNSYLNVEESEQKNENIIAWKARQIKLLAMWLDWDIFPLSRELSGVDIPKILPIWQCKGTFKGLLQIILFLCPNLNYKKIQIEEYTHFFYMDGADESYTLRDKEIPSSSLAHTFDPQLANTIKITLYDKIYSPQDQNMILRVCKLFVPAYTKIKLEIHEDDHLLSFFVAENLRVTLTDKFCSTWQIQTPLQPPFSQEESKLIEQTIQIISLSPLQMTNSQDKRFFTQSIPTAISFTPCQTVLQETLPASIISLAPVQTNEVTLAKNWKYFKIGETPTWDESLIKIGECCSVHPSLKASNQE